MKYLTINEKVLAILLAGCVLTGCGNRVEEVGEKSPAAIMNNIKDEYSNMIDEDYIIKIDTLKNKIDILQAIYDANLDFSQAKSIMEHMDISQLSVEKTTEMIRKAKQPLFIWSNRKQNDEKYDNLDQLNDIKTRLEEELLTEETFNNLEETLRTAIKIEVANALRCNPSYVRIPKRTNHDTNEISVCVRKNNSIDEEVYTISEGGAPETHAATAYLYQYQLTKQGLLESSKENRLQTQQKMLCHTSKALLEGLVPQDNRLIARYTKKSIKEKLETLSITPMSAGLLVMKNTGSLNSTAAVYTYTKR